MEIDDTFTFLLGRWTVSRSIDDRRAATRGSFEGQAALSPIPVPSGVDGGQRARYREDGELRFGAHTGPAARHLIYARLPGGVVTVHFADGGLVATLDLRCGAWTATHDCGEDRYEIATRVTSADRVEERWTVTGPAKDYTASTVLSRNNYPH